MLKHRTFFEYLNAEDDDFNFIFNNSAFYNFIPATGYKNYLYFCLIVGCNENSVCFLYFYLCFVFTFAS